MDSASIKHRRSVRIPGYDYAQGGAYFVTICTAGRVCSLGDIANGVMTRSPVGDVAHTAWSAIPDHYGHVRIDAFIVMPNHVHGILMLGESENHRSGRGTIYRAPTIERQFSTNQKGSLADVIGKFKAAVTREVNRSNEVSGLSFWQRNYYEHIIRNEDDLDRIRQYIADNPAKWAADELYQAQA